MKINSRKSGFTLIELLVVVVIIGLLTTIATTSYLGAQKTARDNTRKADISALATSIETFYSKNKKFPGDTVATSVSTAYKNCATRDAGGNVFYSYYPLTGTSGDKQPCQDRTLTDAELGKSADFKPAPTWIPGLAEFISPMPVEKGFQDKNGAKTGDFADFLVASGTNNSRSYVYRHLDGGYAVYGRLESTVATDGNNDKVDDKDGNLLKSGYAIPDTGLTTQVEGIYLIKK
jgi:general secretion pathway protein G